MVTDCKPVSIDNLTKDALRQEFLDLERFVKLIAITWLPATALLFVLGVMSKSLTLIAATLDYGFSGIMNLAALAVIGMILRQNVFKYPYGTGKLENLAGFLYGIIVIPIGISILYAAVQRYFNAPVQINLNMAPVYAVLLIRRIFFAAWITRIKKRHPDHSPILRTYYFDQMINVANELLVCAGLFLAFFMFKIGSQNVAFIADLLTASLLTLYMIICGVRLIWENLRSLISLPLNENDQMKIFAALCAEHEAYAGLGVVYTQMSGSTRIIQIELDFDDHVTVREIEELTSRIEARLKASFGKMIFHLIPRRRGHQHG